MNESERDPRTSPIPGEWDFRPRSELDESKENMDPALRMFLERKTPLPLKVVMESTAGHLCFSLAGPLVRHSRQSNVWQNLRDEAENLERNETIWQAIHCLEDGLTYEQMRQAVGLAVQPSVPSPQTVSTEFS